MACLVISETGDWPSLADILRYNHYLGQLNLASSRVAKSSDNFGYKKSNSERSKLETAKFLRNCVMNEEHGKVITPTEKYGKRGEF